MPHNYDPRITFSIQLYLHERGVHRGARLQQEVDTEIGGYFYDLQSVEIYRCCPVAVEQTLAHIRSQACNHTEVV